MKFIYKIHSSYDGFRPARLPDRLRDGRFLDLGWRRYFEEVDVDDEVWVYFHGGRFTPGVYVKGVAVGKRQDEELVTLLAQEWSTTSPLTDRETSMEIAELVAPRYRQVFFVPDSWVPVGDCTLTTTAKSCILRRCKDCSAWKALRGIDPAILRRPWRMAEGVIAVYAPAYWAIPPRSFLYYEGRAIDPAVTRTSDLFRRFKVGDANLAYPFGLGMVQSLRHEWHGIVDVVVPIPLSPDKVERGELHRSRALALEVGRLLRAPVADLLSLVSPIGKRALRRVQRTGHRSELRSVH